MSTQRFREPYAGPPEDRAAYLRDNAVAVVDQLNAKVARQAQALGKLNSRRAQHRQLIRQQSEQLAILRAAAEQMLYAISQWRQGGILADGCRQAESDLRAALGEQP